MAPIPAFPRKGGRWV